MNINSQQCIRPGTLYDLNQNPIPNASEGTVILYGNYNDNGNKEFVDCGVNLAKALRKNFPGIFDQNLTVIFLQYGLPLVILTIKIFNVIKIKIFKQYLKDIDN